MWRNLGHLYSEMERSLAQEITYSVGHLQCCRHPSLSFLVAKKAHLSDSLFFMPPLFPPLHKHLHTGISGGDLAAPIPE